MNNLSALARVATEFARLLHRKKLGPTSGPLSENHGLLGVVIGVLAVIVGALLVGC